MTARVKKATVAEIIESVSGRPNNSWNYHKYDDGTFSAWAVCSKSHAINTSGGNIYYSAVQDFPSLPAGFTIVAATAGVTGNSSNACWAGCNNSGYRVFSGASQSASVAGTTVVRLIAYGKWV
jgi:hypothetical protein